MGWNRRDDKSNTHPKILALDSIEADALWNKAGVGCSDQGTGGLVAPHDVGLYQHLAYNRTPAKARKAVSRLVAVGLWHDHETIKDCDRCLRYLPSCGVDELKPGWFLFHDWTDCNKSKMGEDDEVTEFKRQRARRLKDMTVRKGEVMLRDGEWCRYCGVRTTYKAGDQKSRTRRVIDHLDDMGNNDLSNLARACNVCNGQKGARTHLEWAAEGGRMLLAPPVDGKPPQPFPEGYLPVDANDTGPSSPAPKIGAESEPRPGRVPDATPSKSEPDPDPDRDFPSRDARGGPGRIGLDSGPDPAPIGLGRLGSGPGLAGLGRAEAGRIGMGPVGPGWGGREQGASPPSSTTEPKLAEPSPATDAPDRPSGLPS